MKIYNGHFARLKSKQKGSRKRLNFLHFHSSLSPLGIFYVFETEKPILGGCLSGPIFGCGFTIILLCVIGSRFQARERRRGGGSRSVRCVCHVNIIQYVSGPGLV